MMESITTIKQGSLMLAQGTPLPASVRVDSAPCTPGWSLLNNASPQRLKELLTQAGWYFLFIATELEATVYGWNKETAIRKAIRRITAQSKAAQYNCVEIMRVEANRFLGFPFVRITAHSRQIQATETLTGGRARITCISE